MDISPIGLTTSEYCKLTGKSYLTEDEHNAFLEISGYIANEQGIWTEYEPKPTTKPPKNCVVYSVISLFRINCNELTDLTLTCYSNESCLKCVKYLLEQKCQLKKLSIRSTLVSSDAFDLTILKDLCLSELIIRGDKYIGLSELLDYSDITHLSIWTLKIDIDPEIDTRSLIHISGLSDSKFQRLFDLCERNRNLQYNIKSARSAI